MGKKLIIKGADFSSVAVDSLITLDSIAWDGKTYREIFETNNFIQISPGFDNGSYSPFDVNAGEPTITSEVADSGDYSLKVLGTTSQQIKSPTSMVTPNDILIFLAVRVRCDRYEAGKCGLILGTIGASVEETTQGFITVTATRIKNDTSSWYIGSISSANLDCYIDTPVVVLSTYFTNVPTIEQFTQLYNQYVAIKKG